MENIKDTDISINILNSLITTVFINLRKIHKENKEDQSSFETAFTSCVEILGNSKQNYVKIFQLYIFCAINIDCMDSLKYSKFTNFYIREVNFCWYQSFILLEDKINSQNQLKCLTCLVNCLYDLTGIGFESFQTFCSRLEKVAKSFISSGHQLDGLLRITSLYWVGDSQTERKSLVF